MRKFISKADAMRLVCGDRGLGGNFVYHLGAHRGAIVAMGLLGRAVNITEQRLYTELIEYLRSYDEDVWGDCFYPGLDNSGFQSGKVMQ